MSPARKKHSHTAKTNAERKIEADRAARLALFLDRADREQFLHENETHAVPGIGVFRTPPPLSPPGYKPPSEEEAAKTQAHEEEQETASNADIVPTRWTGEIVGNRLIEAYRVLDMLPISTLPAQFKNSMPDVLRDHADRQGEEDLRAKRDRERNRIRLVPSAAQIRRMDEAFLWPIRLLKREKFRRVVFLWALWRARRKHVHENARRCGYVPMTFYRRQEIACLAIAYELNKRSVPVQIAEGVARNARRRPRNSTASTKKKTQVRAIIRGQVRDFS